VLKGDMLPPSVADEQIDDLLRAIPDQPGMLERVVESLFALSSAPADAASPQPDASAAGDAAGLLPGLASWRDAAALSAAGVPMRADAEARAEVLDAIQQACLAHGAVPMQSALVRTLHYHCHRQGCKLVTNAAAQGWNSLLVPWQILVPAKSVLSRKRSTCRWVSRCQTRHRPQCGSSAPQQRA
jgi:hypothetical protein